MNVHVAYFTQFLPFSSFLRLLGVEMPVVYEMKVQKVGTSSKLCHVSISESFLTSVGQSYMILNLSPNIIAICCALCPQLSKGIVHFFLYISVSEIGKFEQGIIIGKHTLSLGYLTYLTMIALNSIGRIDNTTNGFCVLKIPTQIIPFVTPRFDHDGILFAPFFLQIIKFKFCTFFSLSSINQF